MNLSVIAIAVAAAASVAAIAYSARDAASQAHATPMPTQFDERAADVAASFRSEPLDPPFALMTAESLRGVLASDELARMPVQAIDCRAKTCRVEIQDDGSGIVPLKLPMLMVRMADTLPNVSAQRIEQPSGRATMVLYMSK
jgi:hypothetical protein